MTLLVCSACGEPSCFEGYAMCSDALRAPIVTCTCEWGGQEYDTLHLTATDPACAAHGTWDD
jgi:hypothetical protein